VFKYHSFLEESGSIFLRIDVTCELDGGMNVFCLPLYRLFLKTVPLFSRAPEVASSKKSKLQYTYVNNKILKPGVRGTKSLDS